MIIQTNHKEDYQIGQIVHANGVRCQVFDVRDDKVLLGYPGRPPRVSAKFKCRPNMKRHRPGLYTEFDGKLCRIERVEADGLVVSRRMRL